MKEALGVDRLDQDHAQAAASCIHHAITRASLTTTGSATSNTTTGISSTRSEIDCSKEGRSAIASPRRARKRAGAAAQTAPSTTSTPSTPAPFSSSSIEKAKIGIPSGPPSFLDAGVSADGSTAKHNSMVLPCSPRGQSMMIMLTSSASLTATTAELSASAGCEEEEVEYYYSLRAAPAVNVESTTRYCGATASCARNSTGLSFSETEDAAAALLESSLQAQFAERTALEMAELVQWWSSSSSPVTVSSAETTTTTTRRLEQASTLPHNSLLLDASDDGRIPDRRVEVEEEDSKLEVDSTLAGAAPLAPPTTTTTTTNEGAPPAPLTSYYDACIEELLQETEDSAASVCLARSNRERGVPAESPPPPEHYQASRDDGRDDDDDDDDDDESRSRYQLRDCVGGGGGGHPPAPREDSSSSPPRRVIVHQQRGDDPAADVSPLSTAICRKRAAVHPTATHRRPIDSLAVSPTATLSVAQQQLLDVDAICSLTEALARHCESVTRSPAKQEENAAGSVCVSPVPDDYPLSSTDRLRVAWHLRRVRLEDCLWRSVWNHLPLDCLRAWIWWSRRSSERTRRWVSTVVMAAIMICLIVALSSLPLVVTRDRDTSVLLPSFGDGSIALTDTAVPDALASLRSFPQCFVANF